MAAAPPVIPLAKPKEAPWAVSGDFGQEGYLFLNECAFLFNILGLTATRTGRAAPAVMTVITPPATVSPPASTPPPDPTT